MRKNPRIRSFRVELTVVREVLVLVVMVGKVMMVFQNEYNDNHGNIWCARKHGINLASFPNIF